MDMNEDTIDRMISSALRDEADIPAHSGDYLRRVRQSAGGRPLLGFDRLKILAALVGLFSCLALAVPAVRDRLMKVTGCRVFDAPLPDVTERLEVDAGTAIFKTSSNRPLGAAVAELSNGSQLVFEPPAGTGTEWNASIDRMTYGNGANAVLVGSSRGRRSSLTFLALEAKGGSHGTLLLGTENGTEALGELERYFVSDLGEVDMLGPGLVTRSLGKAGGHFSFIGYDPKKGVFPLRPDCQGLSSGTPVALAVQDSDLTITSSVRVTHGLYIRSATNLVVKPDCALRLGAKDSSRPVGISIGLSRKAENGRSFFFSGGGALDFGESDGFFWTYGQSKTWNVSPDSAAGYGRWVVFQLPLTGKGAMTFAGYANDSREYVTYDFSHSGNAVLGQWQGPTYVSGCRLMIGPFGWNGSLPLTDLHIQAGEGVHGSQLGLYGAWATDLHMPLHLGGHGPGFEWNGGAVHIFSGDARWNLCGPVELQSDTFVTHDNAGNALVFRNSVSGPGAFVQGKGEAVFTAKNSYLGGTVIDRQGGRICVRDAGTLGPGPVCVKAGRLVFSNCTVSVASLHVESGATVEIIDATVSVGRQTGSGRIIRRGAKAAFDVSGQETVVRGTDWIPFENRKDIAPGSVLDFSVAGFLDAPAGKYGWLKNRGGRFAFERQDGKACRFYGANLCRTAAMPSDPAVAEVALTRFARMGYNALRLHHIDGLDGLMKDSSDPTALNPEMLDRFDRFVARAIEKGFYLTIDLHSSRSVAPLALGLASDQGEFGKLLPYSEAAFVNWCAYARTLLCHVNPYTGRRYADEPGLPLICLVNEGHPLWTWDAKLRHSDPVKRAWKAWLAEQRRKHPGRLDDVSEDASQQAGWSMNVERFAADFEAQLFRRQREYLRALGVKALLTNQNCGQHFATMQKVRADEYDYVDDHLYNDHPKFKGAGLWQPPSFCRNLDPAGTNALAQVTCAWTRVPGKPMCLTEWSWSGPASHRSAGGLLTGAMAGIQDWSGLWHFDYAFNEEGLKSTRKGWPGYFSLGGDPMAMASDRAMACLFLRGDMPEAENGTVLRIDPTFLGPTNAFLWGIQPRWRNSAWNLRVGVGTDVMPSGWVRRELASERWNKTPPVRTANPHVRIDADRGVFAVLTPRTVGAYVGRGGSAEAGPLTIRVEGDQPTTVWASSVDSAADVASSSRILLTHLTDAQGEKTQFADADHRNLLSWGGGQTLLRMGSARIALRLSAAQTYGVWAVDASGRRRASIPTVRHPDGTLTFAVCVNQPFGACLAYEIAKEEK